MQALVADIDKAVTDTLSLVSQAEGARRAERRGYYLALSLAALLLGTLLWKAYRLDRRRRQGTP